MGSLYSVIQDELQVPIHLTSMLKAETISYDFRHIFVFLLVLCLVAMVYSAFDINRDTDGDGLKDHVNDPDDDNDGILDIHDEDDDGDGILDSHDEDWHEDL